MRAIISILAGYRLLRLAQIDDISLRLRQNINGFINRHERFEILRKLSTCPWCLSVYIASGVITLNVWGGQPWWFIARVLALSAVVGFLGYLDQRHIR